VVDEIRQALERLQAQGVTILLVEQKLDIALESASRAYVLIKGRVRLVEDSAVLARRQNLSQLYFELASQAG
jgi:branched-chain amino acid transport system ATP-binding protein